MSKNKKKTAKTDLQPAPQPEPQPTPPEQAGAAQPEAPSANPVYSVAAGREFKPRRGFETALYAALAAGPATEEDLVKRLLDSGEYKRVAPRAAEARPRKPVAYCLKIWKS